MAKTILCVDDSKTSRTFVKKGLVEILAESVLEIEEASNGRDALELCRNKKYDFVTLDLTMPDMNGYEFLTALQEELIKQTVIVLTADIQPLAEEKVMSLGAAGFIEKPFAKEAMAEMLKKAGVL
jgi:CheY-like chemotaxis protein